MSNSEELSEEAKAEFKLFDKTGAVTTRPLDPGSLAASGDKEKREVVLGKALEFVTEDLLESVELSISVNEPAQSFMKLFSRPAKIGSFRFFFADVFKNDAKPALVEKYFQREFPMLSN